MQVSNFGTKHIQEMVDQGVPLPVLNQVDLHPFMRHPDIVKLCQDNGILLEVSICVTVTTLSKIASPAVQPARVMRKMADLSGVGTASSRYAVRPPHSQALCGKVW